MRCIMDHYLNQFLEIMHFIFHQTRHTDLLSAILTYVQPMSANILHTSLSFYSMPQSYFAS